VTRVLFVSNGHGEAAIADRIASELRLMMTGAELDHLALVGDIRSEYLTDVGPRRALPSGGLIAMGNVPNIARDVAAGLLGLTYAQYRFLRASRRWYAVAVAIGDAYALLMASIARLPTIFVGTAKSVNVAPYGPLEERLLRFARARFVRDEPTAQRLRERGLDVDPAANVIVDLFAGDADDARAQRAAGDFSPVLALFPGSRESAYEDAAFLTSVVRGLAAQRTSAGALLSIASSLDVQRFAAIAQRDGWTVDPGSDDVTPFALRDGDRTVVRAWRGSLAPLLARADLVLGQAGTANEAAAAAGIPVVAFEHANDRGTWYRKRQRGLLGEALAIFPADLESAVADTGALLDDPLRRARMGEEGRARMGPPGGARRIAERIAEIAKS
jgi:uncharacterized protein (TIGR03492 family)